MEPELFQPAAVHELHPLAKFTFFKTIAVRNPEMLVQYLKILNPVDSVDGREQVIRVLKV